MTTNYANSSLIKRISLALTTLGAIATDERVAAVANALSSFPLAIAQETVELAPSMLKRRPVPSDFVALACKLYGVTHQDLCDAGAIAFRGLINLPAPHHDLISSQWRTIYAIKKAFGSLDNFFAPVEPLSWRQKRFVDAYASIDFVLERRVPKEFFLRGSESRPKNGRKLPINLLGDYQTCIQILYSLPHAEIYAVPPTLSAGVPKKPESQAPFSPEQRAQSLACLSMAINELKQSL